MKNNNTVIKSVMDIGNSKVRILVGEFFDNMSRLKVIAYAEAPTKGLKKSIIENPESLTNTITEVLTKLENTFEVRVESVLAGIGSSRIKSETINKKILFAEKEITQEDVEKLYSEAALELVSKELRIMKREMYNIRINSSGIVKNPVGMVAKELSADIHFVLLNEAEVNQYEEVVNRAGLSIERITLNSFASAQAVLDEEEMHKGVAFIDIGEGLTDVLIYKNGKLIYSESIPLGGMHYINDLSYILEISKEEAFEILKKLREHDGLPEKIVTKTNHIFTIKYIKSIIDARTEDLTKFIVKTIEKSGFNGYLGKGIVLTGGTSAIDDLIRKIASETGYKVVRKVALPIRGFERVDESNSSILGLFIKSFINEQERLKEEELREQEAELQKVIEELPEEIEIKEEIEEENFENEDFLDEEYEETKKEKKNFLKPILDWLSNYI